MTLSVMTHRVVYLTHCSWVDPEKRREISEFIQPKKKFLMEAPLPDGFVGAKEALQAGSRGNPVPYTLQTASHARNIPYDIRKDLQFLFSHSVFRLLFNTGKEIELEYEIHSPEQSQKIRSMINESIEANQKESTALWELDTEKAIVLGKQNQEIIQKIADYRDPIIRDHLTDDYSVIIGRYHDVGGKSISLGASIDNLSPLQKILSAQLNLNFDNNPVFGTPYNWNFELSNMLASKLSDSEIEDMYNELKTAYPGLKQKSPGVFYDKFRNLVTAEEISLSVCVSAEELLESKGVNVEKLRTYAPFAKEFYADMVL
jgi:hypothetical protein